MKEVDLVKKVAEEFDLYFNSKDKFKFLILSKREVIIRNFLGNCPDPIYVKYGNMDKKNIGEKLFNFLNSEEYKNDISRMHGCVIHNGDAEDEIKKVKIIKNTELKEEVLSLYEEIKNKIKNSKRLTLISKPSKKEINTYNEILLHEFIHELFENNKIRPRLWKWNEGLITYVEYFILNKHHLHENGPFLENNKMWNIYARYAHRWAKLLKDVKNPGKRKEIILKKIKEVDRRYKEKLTKF